MAEITKAWNVGQWRGVWYGAAVCHTWEAVEAAALALRVKGWTGPIEAMAFFCIVDGAAVYEVKASPINERGEWLSPQTQIVKVGGGT